MLWWDVGFLMNEKIESFVWLFETFLKAMGNVQPKTMMADQAFSMANAIEKVFPLAKHRLCTWHSIGCVLGASWRIQKRILVILEYWVDLLISLTMI